MCCSFKLLRNTQITQLRNTEIIQPQPPTTLLSEGTRIAPAIIHFLCSAGLDPLLFLKRAKLIQDTEIPVKQA